MTYEEDLTPEQREHFHSVLVDIIKAVLGGDTGPNPYNGVLCELQKKHEQKAEIAKLDRLWGEDKR